MAASLSSSRGPYTSAARRGTSLGRLDDHPPAVLGATDATDETGPFETVDRPGRAAPGQVGGLRQLAGGHRPAREQEVEAAPVRPVEPSQLGHGCVEQLPVHLRELAPTLHHDFRLVEALTGRTEVFRDVQAEVLLLGGSRSPRYLKDALATLEQVLPHCRTRELQGLGHAASWNADRGGAPERVARELVAFFG